MRRSTLIRHLLLCAFFVFTATGVNAGERIVSTMRNVNAVWSARGFYLAPAPEFSGEHASEDLAPVQAFEIIRPRDVRVTIGRLHTSCSCVALEAPQKTFEAGERAILKLRNVIPTPPAGQNYAIYVQLTSPIRTTLRFDTFVQSGFGQYVTGADLMETEPEAKDNAETGSTIEPEIIVPKADVTTQTTDVSAQSSESQIAEPAIGERMKEAEEAAEAIAIQETPQSDKIAGEEEKGDRGEAIEIIEAEIKINGAETNRESNEMDDIDPEMVEDVPESDVVEKIVLKAKEEAEEASAAAEK